MILSHDSVNKGSTNVYRLKSFTNITLLLLVVRKMLNHYATIRRAPRITKMMEATVTEDPPGVEVVVSGSGNIGSSALHLS